MSKKLLILFGIICCGIAVLIFALTGRERICLPEPVQGVLLCQSRDIPLTNAHAQEIAEILDGHRFFGDSLSCGFSENAALTLTSGDKSLKLYLASDGCPFLFSPDKRKYVRLTESEMGAIHKILKRYGLTFPCV